MKAAFIICLIVTTCIGTAAQEQDPDKASLIRPADPAYADAMDFVSILNDRGVAVQSVHASKLNGFFRGIDKAAYYKTSDGVFEVIFFPDGADKISVRERREGSRYIYSFEGQPEPNPPGDIFNSARPMYFLARRNLFIVVLDLKLFDDLPSGLAGN